MFIVMTTEDGVLEELLHVGIDRDVAQQHFISGCQSRISNWDEYEAKDVAAVLDNGYEKYGTKAIMLINTENWTTSPSDNELGVCLTGQIPLKVKRVKKWLRSGEIGRVDAVEDITIRAGRLLDKSCAYDICGEVVFQGEDDEWYILTVGAEIGKINPQYLQELMENSEE